VGPTVLSKTVLQAIYYAQNISAAAAGTNTVTVAFSPAAAYPDVRILEYSRIDPANAFDVCAGASGSSATCSSPAVKTTNAADLLVGGNTVQTMTTGPGGLFTKRLLSDPNGDIAEDRLVTVAGTNTASAPLNYTGWVMQVAAFRAAGSPAVIRPLAYVQGSYATPQSPVAMVAVPYTKAQTAGNLNAVIVGWNDSPANVRSVTDTNGNVYQLAVGPTVLSGSLSQSIYYAKNIAAPTLATNSVTVNFNKAASNPDIRILEYSRA
jgi:hypothetical protein